MANIESIYASIPSLGITESQVKELRDKIKKYRLTGWPTCTQWNNVTSSTPQSELIIRYNNLINLLTQYEYKLSSIVTSAYIELESNKTIERLITKRWIPHIKDVISSSNSTSSTNIEMSSSLKTFSIELAVKTMLVLLHKTQLTKTELTSRIVDEINKNVTSGNDISRLFQIESLNLSGYFHDSLFGPPGISQDEKDLYLWQLMPNLIRSTKTVDEVQNAVTNGRFLGHEINELISGLPMEVKNLIKYKAMSNLAHPEFTKKINSLQPEDFFNEIDFLLMTLGFKSKKEVQKQSKMIEEQTDAFVKFRYLEGMSNEEILELLTSVSTASYMVLDYLMNNPVLLDRNEKFETYESLESIFTREEYDKINSLIVTNQSQIEDRKSLIYFYAYMKTYIGTRQIDINDKRFKNINVLFKTIQDSNNIAELGNLFHEWYSNIDINDLSIEELNELKNFNPKYLYSQLSQIDKLVYKKCESAGIEFEYYYKVNLKLLEQLLEKYGRMFQGKSIPNYYFNMPFEVIDAEYQYRMHNTNINSLEGLDGADTLEYLSGNDFPIISEHTLTIRKLSSIELYPKKESTDVYISGYYDALLKQKDRQRRLKKIIEVIENNNMTQNEIIATYGFNQFVEAMEIIGFHKYTKLPISQLTELSDTELIKLSRDNGYKEYPRIPFKDERISELLFMQSDEYKEMLGIYENMEIESTMHFQTIKQTLKLLELYRTVNPDAKPSSSLYYRSREEVEEIVGFLRDKQVEEVPTEILYFSPEEIRSYLPKISMIIEYEKDNNNFTMDSIKRIRASIEKDRVKQNKKQQLLSQEQHDNELQMMFANSDGQFQVTMIDPTIVTSIKKQN